MTIYYMVNKLAVYLHNEMNEPVIYVPKQVNFSNVILHEKASCKKVYRIYYFYANLIAYKAIV